jgi:hypothetical protein
LIAGASYSGRCCEAVRRGFAINADAMRGKEVVKQGLHPRLAGRAPGCSRIGLEGMLVLPAVAAMKPYQCRQNKTARIRRRLGEGPLELLDPGETPLEATGHF